MKKLMTGNEAVARGAYEGGVKVCSAYPGTPSTEIFENLPQYKPDLYCEWAPNEKVALETAYGASIAGARSMCAMKHVGLNVAADPLFTAAYNGVGRGFVIITADDPSMHSSQNEQDNRYYAKFAKIPMVEPSDSQECKDYIAEAFKISEKFDIPVLFRTVTRICHSKSLVEFGDREEVEPLKYVRNTDKYVSTPAHAYKNHPLLEEKLKKLTEYSENCSLNTEEINETSIGVVSSSIAYQYTKEVFGQNASYLKIGLSFPLPIEKIRAFSKKVKSLIIIEELEPFMEEQIKAAGIECTGKDLVPLVHELNPEILRSKLLGEKLNNPELDVKPVSRPPALCPGCPHRGFFYTLSKIKNAVICGDIGCYTLGCAPPLNAMDSVVCMGGGFSLAHGFAKTFEAYNDTTHKVFGVLGDSTFFHSGITGAVQIFYNKGNVIPVILDNRITSMTGQQDNPGTGFNLLGEQTEIVNIEKIMLAIGYEKVITVDPQDLKEMKKAIDDALNYSGKIAIICKRPCVLLKRAKIQKKLYKVDIEKCRSCKSCLKVGCPAISMENGKAYISPTLCIGCSVCAQVCPFDAIKEVENGKN